MSTEVCPDPATTCDPGCGIDTGTAGSVTGMPSYRLIDMAGSEIGIIEDGRDQIELHDEVALPDGGTGTVADVYDDEFGREGGVVATLAVDDGSPQY
jgi:hypothetical protein